MSLWLRLELILPEATAQPWCVSITDTEKLPCHSGHARGMSRHGTATPKAKD
jgi:hypothetical protein